jgi:hypothetical protein
MHTKFWSENLKGIHHAGVLRVDDRIILDWIVGKQDEKVWTGSIWLMTGIGGGWL